MCALSVTRDPNLIQADSEDSDQTGRKGHLVGFVTLRLKQDEFSKQKSMKDASKTVIGWKEWEIFVLFVDLRQRLP